MKYPYIPENQLSNGFEPLKPGIYKFSIKEASEKISKSSGLPMIKLLLNCWNDQGDSGIVFDYLVATENQVWKIKQLSDCVGDPSIYSQDSELTPRMLMRQQGLVELHIIKGEGFPDSSKVKAYLKQEKNSAEDYIKSKDEEFLDTSADELLFDEV